MRILRLSAPLALLCAAGLAAADGGLKVDAAGGFWSDVQTKLRFSARGAGHALARPATPAIAECAGLGAAGGQRRRRLLLLQGPGRRRRGRPAAFAPAARC